MATQQATATSTGSFSSLSISGTTSRSGNMSWSTPTLPDNYTIISTSVTYTLAISMFIGSATVTVNGATRTNGTHTDDLGTSLTNSVSVTAKGSGRYNFGSVSISDITYSVTYQYDEGISDPPIITIQSQDVTKISSVTGYDRCTVTFTSDQALSYWEARATTTQTPAHGVGTLVESGTLAKNETGYIYVDDEELINGDVNYTITIYGQNSDGVWSDE